MKIKEVLELAAQKGTSDLHLRNMSAPVFRINGALITQGQLPVLNSQDLENIFQELTDAEQKSQFAKQLNLDFSCDVPALGRFRVSVIRERRTLSFAIRLVPTRAPDIDQIGLPKICKEIILKPRGLILITGHTGSGKSTTLTAMVNFVNETLERNIMTIEDPIEYVYKNRKSIILQQELGEDTLSFSDALKHTLRHDPDVIVVGEMRDMDTMGIAIRAAETGHLVISTMHTNDAPQTLDTITHMFPPTQHEQIRMQLSRIIEAVICQTLVRRADGTGRVAVCEVMTATTAVRNLIREGKTHELANVIQYSTKDGMQSRNQVLVSLVKQGVVNREDALGSCSNAQQFANALTDSNNLTNNLLGSGLDASNKKQLAYA